MAAPTSRTVAAAAAQGDEQTLQALLDQGADMNQKSKDGMTPLAIAAFWGYANIVKILLKYGADINAQNTGTLWTPLHCAAFQGHGPVILRMMEARPDLAITDMRGRKSMDFASAMDGIWPLFAAAGCKRTPPAQLMKMDIIYRPGTEEAFPDDGQTVSGYHVKPIEMADYTSDPNMEVAAITGDVLADTSEDYGSHYRDSPSLNVYDN